MIQKAVEEGFIRETQKDIVIFKDDVQDLIEALVNYSLPTGRFKISWKDS